MKIGKAQELVLTKNNQSRVGSPTENVRHRLSILVGDFFEPNHTIILLSLPLKVKVGQ